MHHNLIWRRAINTVLIDAGTLLPLPAWHSIGKHSKTQQIAISIMIVKLEILIKIAMHTANPLPDQNNTASQDTAGV